MTRPTDPVDPDVEPPLPGRGLPSVRDLPVVAAVAAGGVLGSESRYALGLALPHSSGSWPLATFLINVSGCLAIGALMVVLTELTSPHRLVRPFLGVGVLGGWTTFSTAMVDVVALLRAGRPGIGVAYLLGTALAAVGAVALGSAAVRAVGVRTGPGRPRGPAA
jgi:CrcB protein